jgi:5-methyltetrahydrofolate--homocysteine methyltransferase
MSLEEVKTAVVNGKRKDVKRLVPAHVEAGTPPREILDEALIPAMSIVGERFKKNEIFVPEMLVSARAMKTGLDIIEPALLAAGIKPEFKAVLGTVEGDLHDIGKNLVGIMWKGAGFEVIDLGTNVSPDVFVEAIREHNPHVVGLSALLTTTLPSMEKTIQAIREAGLSEVKVLVGGAPVTEKYAEEIGASGYARDAASAVDVARGLLAS